MRPASRPSTVLYPLRALFGLAPLVWLGPAAHADTSLPDGKRGHAPSSVPHPTRVAPSETHPPPPPPPGVPPRPRAQQKKPPPDLELMGIYGSARLPDGDPIEITLHPHAPDEPCFTPPRLAGK